jgi:large subunit ribosomal protein L11
VRPIPVVITYYQDKSFTFVMKTPPVSFFLKKAAKLKSGHKTPGKADMRQGHRDQVREIAEKKMAISTPRHRSAMLMVEGSARSMGLEV